MGIVCDFTNLPFGDNEFSLVVFDPLHLTNTGEDSLMNKVYTKLDEDWRKMLHDGFAECMRVLKPDGVLIFKWSDISISTRQVINALGQEPLFGHRSGKTMNTRWLCFMKQDHQTEKGGEE